jgi:hypothetical protein
MMLLDPFLSDSVAEHQRVLREAAEHARRAGARGPGRWRLPLGVSAAVESRTVPSAHRDGWSAHACSRAGTLRAMR